MNIYKHLISAALLFVYFTEIRAEGREPNTWIDKETGHRVINVSSEPFSTLPYFTANSSSSDNNFMVYSSGTGLHLINLKDLSTQAIVRAGASDIRFLEMGRKSNRLFYMSKRPERDFATLESIDIYTKKVVVHASLPVGYHVESVNADESLAAGIFEEPSIEQEKLLKSLSGKANLLYERAKQKIPMTLFTINLNDGAVGKLYRSTEWLSHPQFSPTDPTLLLYSLEGPWHQVDRLWLIKANGDERKLIHHRTMNMEITGHEFWSKDGQEIHYDWQYPKGANFFLASYDVRTGNRRAIPLDRDQWSTHFNGSTDPTLFVGDGADKLQVARSLDSSYILQYKVRAPRELLINSSF